MELAKLLTLKDDRAEYMRAKLWRKRNQRISFPIPKHFVEAAIERGIDPTTATLNGIFVTVWKVPSKPESLFDRDREWLVTLRDVVMTDASGKREPVFYRSRRINKWAMLGFTLSMILGREFIIKPQERRRNNG